MLYKCSHHQCIMKSSVIIKIKEYALLWVSLAVLHCFSQIIPKQIVGSVWYFNTKPLFPSIIYGPHSILLYVFTKEFTPVYLSGIQALSLRSYAHWNECGVLV